MARGQLFTVKGQPILAGPSCPPPTVGSPRPSLVGRGHGARTEPRQPRAPVRPRPAPRMLADGNPNRSCGKEALRQPRRDPQNSRPSSLSAEGPPGHPLASIQFLAQTQKLAPNVRQPDTTCYRHDTDSAGSSFYLCVCVCFQITEPQPNTGNGPRRDLGAQKRVGPAGRRVACVYLNVLGGDPRRGGEDGDHARREGEARPGTPASPFKETLEQIAPQRTS